MTSVPPNPKVYHITHVDNLAAILQSGGLYSDAMMRQHSAPHAVIGMSHIKQARLTLPVACWPGDCVGDYVPFYFSPRSVMLYVIYCGNHSQMSFADGQTRVVHLEADLHEVVQWVATSRSRWAFSLSNASAAYAEFRNTTAALSELDWQAIQAKDWRSCREAKQAEFLVHTGFPWHLFRRIGVHSAITAREVGSILTASQHRPLVEIKQDWYY